MKQISEEVFRDLYDMYYEDVYRFVYQMSKQKNDIEDIVQDVFILAYRSFDSFRGECSYKTWLFSIAHHYMNSLWRKWFRRKKIFEQYERQAQSQSASYSVDGEWERRLLTQQLYESLNQIPNPYREVIVLRYIHEFSAVETALILSMKGSRVRVLTHRGMIKLREIWSKGEEIECMIESQSLNH